MRMWTHKKERRYFLRVDVKLPAVFCVLGPYGKAQTRPHPGKVVNLTHEGCCLELSFLKVDGFHMHRCLEEPERYPLRLSLHPSAEATWHLTSQVVWINRDLERPGGEFKVGLAFEPGSELPRGWRRKAAGK